MKNDLTIAERLYNMSVEKKFMYDADTKCREIVDMAKTLRQIRRYADIEPEFQTLINTLDLITDEDD